VGGEDAAARAPLPKGLFSLGQSGGTIAATYRKLQTNCAQVRARTIACGFASDRNSMSSWRCRARAAGVFHGIRADFPFFFSSPIRKIA
jgi:hypothetical protein